jgi:hypothetical protein
MPGRWSIQIDKWKHEAFSTQLLWKFLLTDQTYKVMRFMAGVFKTWLTRNPIGGGIKCRILQLISLLQVFSTKLGQLKFSPHTERELAISFKTDISLLSLLQSPTLQRVIQTCIFSPDLFRLVVNDRQTSVWFGSSLSQRVAVAVTSLSLSDFSVRSQSRDIYCKKMSLRNSTLPFFLALAFRARTCNKCLSSQPVHWENW